MLHVNLIRERAIANAKVAKTALVCMTVMAMSILGGIGLSVPNLTEKAGLDREAKQYKQQGEALQNSAEDIQKEKDQLKELDPLVAMVHESRWSCVDWLRVLMAVHRNLPDLVWLNSVSTTFDADKCVHTVKIEGQATQHSEVAAVMDALGETNVIRPDGIKLEQTTEVSLGSKNDKYTQFTIDAQLQYVIGENVH